MKTLKYAVQEVLLVFIGISIAIQANNWNESRKFKEEQGRFLVSLLEELNEDLDNINNKIAQFSEINDLIKNGIFLLNNNTLDESETKILNRSITAFPILTPLSKNVERNNLVISNGIIKNKIIKIMLLEYYEKTSYFKEVQTKFGETLQLLYVNSVSPLVRINSHSQQEMQYSIKKLNASNNFHNAFDLSIGYRDTSINFLNEQKDMVVNLIKIIEDKII